MRGALQLQWCSRATHTCSEAGRLQVMQQLLAGKPKAWAARNNAGPTGCSVAGSKVALPKSHKAASPAPVDLPASTADVRHAGVKDAEKHRLLRLVTTALGSEVESARIGVLEPPEAKKVPFRVKAPHGAEREDRYYWLRDDERANPEMLAYLEAEGEYTKAAMADTESLQAALFRELRGRIQEADQTAPLRKGGYFYYVRTLEGQQYQVFCRRKVSNKAEPPSGLLSEGFQQAFRSTEKDSLDESQPEEILLDANAEAEKYSFYMLGSFAVSPDHSKLAYAEDTTGNEKYTLFVKDLASGKQLLAKPIENTAGDVAWASDNATLFYVTLDSVLRHDKVWRHRIGTDPTTDALVFHETDASFNVGVELTRSERYIFIESVAAVTSETRIVGAATPEQEFRVVLPRQNDVEYSLWDRGDHFFVQMRDQQRPNKELLIAPSSDPTSQEVLLPHREDVKLESAIVSKNHIVVFQRQSGQQTAVAYQLATSMKAPKELSGGTELKFEEPAYAVGPGEEGDFDSDVLRLQYSSLTTPTTVIDQHLGTGERQVKKVMPVLGGFQSSHYKSEKEWAAAEDGAKVPISLVYRKGLVKLDGSDPLLLDAYGSYGICNDPRFDRDNLSLLDRGFIFAIAHVRGGGELGRFWYENGKYKHKMNTFTDFVAAAEHLIEKKYTQPSRLCIQGRSAGGLTMGAVLNLRPDLFNSAILGVPFVDVVTTMLDESIPLTTGEFEEWGNPAKKDYYDYMVSYSPVDNIERKAYPNMLVLAGLHDPRVAYWEPAKYVAKLRDLKTNDSLLLLKCDMGAGHFSQSGRFDQLKDVALEHAFLLKTQGLLTAEAAG